MLSNSIEDAALRRHFWAASRALNGGNLEVLGQLVQHRHRVATKLGFASHAHKYLANKVYTRPEEVNAFLRDISDKIRPKAELEHKAMVTFAKASSPLSAGGVKDRELEFRIPAWDASYWSGRYKQHIATADLNHPSSSTSNSGSSGPRAHEGSGGTYRGSPSQAIAAMVDYLGIDDCLQGLCLITKEVFGLHIEEADFAPGEAWCSGTGTRGSAASTIDPRSSGLRKFVVRRDTSVSSDGIDGIMYLDLFTREDKFTGSAHFTAQAGCGNVSPLSRYRTSGAPGRNRIISSDPSIDMRPWGAWRRMDSSGERQIPIIALAFNFSSPTSQPSLPKPSSLSSPRLSSLGDLVTLYHEWGHGLHSLLSHTTFQHVSGTRGGVDVSEIPSHLFECFARDARVVSKWARHSVTGLPPPSGKRNKQRTIDSYMH